MHDPSKINQEMIKENSLLKQRIQELEVSEAKRKQAEDALRTSELRYQTIFETTGTTMIIVEEDMTIFLVNDRFESLTGYTREEVEGKRKWTEFVEKDDLEKMITQHQVRRADSGLAKRDYEFRLVHRDGHLKNILLTVDLIPGTKRSVASLMDITDRKQAEEALRASEEKYRLIAENTADLISTLDMNLRFTYISPATMRLRGFTVEEAMEQTLEQILTTQSMQHVIAIYEEEMLLEASGTADPDRTRILELEEYKKNGSIIWVEVSLSFLRDKHRKPIGILVVSRDITERKLAKEDLKREQTQLFLIFDQMPAEVSVLDPHTYEILFMNRCARELYGQDSTGRFCYDVFYGYKAPCQSCNNKFLLENDDESIQKEDFSERLGRHYLSTNSLIRWPDGRSAKLEISIDITERKKVEDALRDSEERHRRLIEALSEAVLLRSKDIVIYANPAAFKLFRANHPGDLIGKRYLDLVHPDDRAISAERAKKSIDENQTTSPREHRILALDGQTVYVESTGVPFKYRGETHVFGVFRDITERKRTEEEKRSLEERLRRSEKMEALGQLAGGVAHDLNNVLGVLSGYSELLLEEIPKGSRSRGHAEKILQSTEKGAAIIQDLLTLARRGVTASDVINLNSVVSCFLKTPVYEKMKDYHPRVTFRTECDKNLMNIKGSPIHLEKTLMNLMSNAVESISGNGEVTIRTENSYLDKAIGGYDEVKEGDYVVLTVSDTGIGIPVENREKIFEPFYTKKAMGRSGTGLGLTIVWGTVKDHNGYINVQTEVGEGTTFTLYFPVTREELIAQQQKAPIERYMGKGESILVVDDIAEQRDIAAGLLTRLGYEVHVVSSGEEAVEYLKVNKSDILVLDMIMAPGIDGLETYQRVLEINPKQKAILVSGFSETQRVRKAQELGAGAYVKKPYIMEKIGVAVRDELDRK
jgi:PAS domain S-box-containing protein